jgi:phosphate starvation-inducible membrane PsiE
MNTKTHDKHDVGKIEHFYRRVLHILELVIAAISIVVLLIALGIEIYSMATTPDYFTDIHHFLHNILTIVVGLEFIRMLIDMTPGNTLEVLIMATARHIIMNHDNDWTLLIGIICIAILFATRRYLIRRSEMTEDLVELE